MLYKGINSNDDKQIYVSGRIDGNEEIITATGTAPTTTPTTATDNETPILINPDECITKNHNCSIDNIGRFLETGSQTFIHAPNPAIPQHRRIPRQMANNATYILQQRNVLPVNGTATALTEYNPTILPLYKTQPDGTIVSDIDDKLLSYLTGRYHPEITDYDKVKYISVERSSNHHSCGVGLPRKNNQSAEQCMLAISLLDEQLRHIPGAQLVVDLDHYIFLKHVGLSKKTDQLCFVNDVSIFVTRTSKENVKKDQLFIMTSSSNEGMIMFPVDLRRTPRFVADTEGWDTKLVGVSLTRDMYDDGTLYGDGLQLRLLEGGKNKKYRKECYNCRMRKFVREFGGFIDLYKNYHYFEDVDGSAWLELNPALPHEAIKMDLMYDSGLTSLENLTFFPNTTWVYSNVPNQKIMRHYFPNATLYKENHFPGLNFQSINIVEKKSLQKGLRYRGTACCIDLTINDNATSTAQAVKVGIGHTVTKERAYLSYFYAFQPSPPFRLVAMSGYFCLHGMKDTDVGYSDHWASELPKAPSMTVKEISYSCPKVTFASGISEMVGDWNKVLISYGVNDCYSRTIALSKDKIVMMLEGSSYHAGS